MKNIKTLLKSTKKRKTAICPMQQHHSPAPLCVILHIYAKIPQTSEINKSLV